MKSIFWFFISLLFFTPQRYSVQIDSTTSIYWLAWNPAGSILAVRGTFAGDHLLKFYDGAGEFIRQVELSLGEGGISWRPDGAQIATFDFTGYTIWDVKSGMPLSKIEQFYATYDERIYWNLVNFDQVATIEGKVAHIRDSSTGEIFTTLDADDGNPDFIYGAGWDFSGTKLYTVSSNSVIRTWDVVNTMLLEEEQVAYDVTAFTMNSAGTQLAIAHSDGTVRFYDATSLKVVNSTELLANQSTRMHISYIRWSADDTVILASSHLGFYLWDIEADKLEYFMGYSSESHIRKRSIDFSETGILTYPALNGRIIMLSIANANID